MARDMIHGESGDTRSSALRPLNVDDDVSQERNNLDLARHLTRVAVYGASVNLSPTFPIPADMRNTDVLARHKADLDRLSSDLALSRHIVHSEDIVRHASQALDSQATVLNSPEDLFAQAAAKLSLKDKGPPPIEFAFLTPRPASHEDQAESGGDSDPLQAFSARALMEEWVVGSDARAYEWKSWTDNVSEPESAPGRIIRPLPTPRSPLRFDTTRPQSQYGPSGAQSQAPPLRAAASLPSLTRFPPVVARSSPPRATSSGDMTASQGMLGSAIAGGGDMVVQTQVEPGKFGGRNAGGTKKKVKKRAGGF